MIYSKVYNRVRKSVTTPLITKHSFIHSLCKSRQHHLWLRGRSYHPIDPGRQMQRDATGDRGCYEWATRQRDKGIIQNSTAFLSGVSRCSLKQLLLQKFLLQGISFFVEINVWKMFALKLYHKANEVPGGSILWTQGGNLITATFGNCFCKS